MMMSEKNNVEVATENHEEFESISMERKPRSRERGPDKKPRIYRANSMNNFVQFKDRQEVFVKYLKDEKGVDITGNSGMWRILLIIVGVAFAGFGGLWLYNHYKSEKDIVNNQN